MSANGWLMVLALIELGQGSSGSEPWSPPVTHLPPAALLGKARITLPPPPSQSQFLQLNQNSHGAKINVAIVGAQRHILTMANAKNSEWQGLLAWWDPQIRLWGGPTLFFKLSHKGGLVLRRDNGTSKRLVKLTLLCAIIQTFDLKNVFVPSSTSANIPPPPHLPLLLCPIRSNKVHSEKERKWKLFWWRRKQNNLICWKENVGPTDNFGCLAFVVWIKIKVSFCAVTWH